MTFGIFLLFFILHHFANTSKLIKFQKMNEKLNRDNGRFYLLCHRNQQFSTNFVEMLLCKI